MFTRQRFVLMVFAYILFLTFFVSTAMAEEKTEIVMWEVYGPTREFDKLTEEFNREHPNIKVTDVFFPGHTPLLQKLQVVSGTKTGELPDIIFYDCINTAITNELVPLVDLTKFFNEEETFQFDDFYPVFQSFSTIDGKIISLHGWANCEMLFYNKKLFEEAALDPENPPTNWEELIEYGKKLTTPEHMGLAFGFQYNDYFEELSWEWQSLVVSAGGKIWNDDYTAPAFNSEAGIEALQFLVDCIHKYKIMSLDYPEKGFENGRAAMLIDGSWMGKDYTDALKENLGVAVLPGKIKPAPNVGGEHFMIVQSEEKKEKAAWEFVKYMLSPKANVRVCELSGMVPTRKSITESEEFKSFLNSCDPEMRKIIEVTTQSMEYAFHRAPIVPYLQCSEAIAQKLELALYGKISPEQAITEAEKAVKDILSSFM